MQQSQSIGSAPAAPPEVKEPEGAGRLDPEPARLRSHGMTPRTATRTEPVVAGNVYPKYSTRNPVARALVTRFLDVLKTLVRRTGAHEIHEVGCGEGHLSSLLAAEGWRVRGSDLSPAAIAEARRHASAKGLAVPFAVRDLYDLDPARDGAELVVCCEVLEHVPDPVRALAILKQLARPHLIVSVPREPLWRGLNLARGSTGATSATRPVTSSTGRLAPSRPCSRSSLRWSTCARRCPGPWRSAGRRRSAGAGLAKAARARGGLARGRPLLRVHRPAGQPDSPAGIWCSSGCSRLR